MRLAEVRRTERSVSGTVLGLGEETQCGLDASFVGCTAFDPCEELHGRSVKLNPAAVQRDDPVGKEFHVLGEVRGQEDQPVLRQRSDEPSKGYPMFGIDSDGHLVEDEHGRFMDEGLGDEDTLAGPTGKLPELRGAPLVEIDCRDSGAYGGAVVRTGDPMQPRGVADRLHHGVGPTESRMLWNEPQVAPGRTTPCRRP